MTDLETLLTYRITQAEETLKEAEKMMTEGFSPRSIINRAYYSMFYALMALFIKAGVSLKTSKHRGVISLFDRELVKSGAVDKKYSVMLHETFDERLEGDYKEFVDLSGEDAQRSIDRAGEFLAAVKEYKSKGT